MPVSGIKGSNVEFHFETPVSNCLVDEPLYAPVYEEDHGLHGRDNKHQGGAVNSSTIYNELFVDNRSYSQSYSEVPFSRGLKESFLPPHGYTVSKFIASL